MPRGGTSEQGTNRVNGLAIAANDPADVTLAKLQFEDRGFSAGQSIISSAYSTNCRMMNSRNSFT